jgi:hypothetical protein
MPDPDARTDEEASAPTGWGTWDDAEVLRRWSFERRTPEQRLDWLRSALALAYQSGAITPRRPMTAEEWESLRRPGT